MKKLLASLAVSAVVLFSACATLQVTTDYDHSKDFAGLKTYALHDNIVSSNATVSSLNADRITTAVRDALNAKGYVEAAGKSDFLVNINAVVQNKKQVTANTDFYGGPYAYGGIYRPYAYWGGPVSATTSFNVDDYKDGSLIIDMVDPATKKLFWEGVGNSEIDGTVNNPEQRITDAVTKILASFPSVGGQPVTTK